MASDNENRENPWKKKDAPPDIEEVVRRLKSVFGGSGASLAIIIVVGLTVLGLFSAVYQIETGAVGVVQRFGRYVDTVENGLHFKAPFGIDTVTKIRNDEVVAEEFGMRTMKAGVRTQYAPERQYQNESLMLTGDLNCVLVPWVVQYTRSDPYKYLFKVRDVRGTLHDISEAIMRQVVGDRSINEVITERREIAVEAKRELQKALDEAETGINVVNLELKKTTVPEAVQPSFNEVNEALQEKEKMIYQAREAYNKVIPAARGEAERMIKDAEGYALERINRATGDANRFMALLKEYSKAKDVTRRRLYLEAMGEVIPRLGTKYILDSDQQGLLPLLDLGRKGGK
jgi:membrane protease subunit HflK